MDVPELLPRRIQVASHVGRHLENDRQDPLREPSRLAILSPASTEGCLGICAFQKGQAINNHTTHLHI
jgi:hypothetical protein